MLTMTSRHKHPQYNLRIPQELKEQLAEEAEKHARSLNAEIVARLQESIERQSNQGEPASETEGFLMTAVLDQEQKMQQLLDRMQHLEKLLMEKQ